MASLSEDEVNWRGLAEAFSKLPFEGSNAQSGQLVIRFTGSYMQVQLIVAGLPVPEHKRNHSIVLESKSETRLWKKVYSTYKSLKKACK